MRLGRLRNIVLGGLLAMLAGVFAFSAEHNKVLSVGKKAPAWKDLVGVDGKRHNLEDLKKAKVVAVVFTCNTCPVAQAYEGRLIKLVKDYKAKDVEVIAINVNNIPGDKLDKMKERAKEKEFNFAYLYDPSQKIARDYGATVTPHCFVLDRERNVAYMGAVDDNQKEAEAKKHYLRDAVDALLAGKKPAVEETKQFGCTIKYETT